MGYSIEITPAAREELRDLPRSARAAIGAEITALGVEPRHVGVRKLEGHSKPPIHRVRVGDYRVLLVIDDTAQVVYVTAVRHRSKVYRRR